MSGRSSYMKDMIGTIEKDGRLYRAHNDLFTVSNKPYGAPYNFEESYLYDQIDEGGYRFSFSSISDILNEYYIYRNHTTRKDFEEILSKHLAGFGSRKMRKYSNITKDGVFKCYFESYVVIDDSKFTNTGEQLIHRLSVLFCYSDKIQILLTNYNRNGHEVSEWELDHLDFNERRLLYYFNNNLTINEKLFNEGIPEAISKMN